MGSSPRCVWNAASPAGRSTRSDQRPDLGPESRGRRPLGSWRARRSAEDMTCTLHVAWDERLAGYDFGPGHPMAPLRLTLTMELARAFGLFRLDGVSAEVPAAATRAELELYHLPGYIDIVRLAGSGRPPAPGQEAMT